MPFPVSYHRAETSQNGLRTFFEAVLCGDRGLYRLRRAFGDEVLSDATDDNALRFGEWLRDWCGYGPAGDLLSAAGVPETSLLWKRGHKG